MEVTQDLLHRHTKDPGRGHRPQIRKPDEITLRTKSDKYADPTVLTAAERLAELGDLMFRAVERLAAKRADANNIPDVSETQHT